MTTEEAQPSRPISGQPASPTAAPTLASQTAGLEIDLAEVERAVWKLLRSYRIALQYASDMPMLGRSEMVERPRRWGSRFYARVYVETHVRKQLQAIRDCLRLIRLEAVGPEEKKIDALEEELERHVKPLFRWRQLVGLVARLPPVAAALPVLFAASAWPLAKDVSFHDVRNAFLVLAGTALLLWILIVWPSIRLGFRVKRAIFAGGLDLLHPLLDENNEVKWEGFRAPSFYDDAAGGKGRQMPFPNIDVYHAENDVFRALRRRKPAEVPLDMLLGLAPYLWTAYSVFFVYGLINAVAAGDVLDRESPWLGLFLGAVLATIPVGFAFYGSRSYRKRRH
jgi:hypothetical protein